MVVAAAIAGVAEGGLGVRDVVHVEISRRGEEVGLCASPPLGALYQAARAAGALVALLPSHARGTVLCCTVLHTYTFCIALHSFLHVHSASLELDHSDQTSAHCSSILSYSQDKRTIIFAPSVCVDYTSTHIVLNMMLY